MFSREVVDEHVVEIRSAVTGPDVPVRVWALRALGRFMLKRGYIDLDPCRYLHAPRSRRVPNLVLTVEEVERVLASIDVSTTLGLRNRAILEVLWSSGLRRSELIHVRLCDIDRDRGLLFVHRGKGAKDRWIPIGNRALAYVDRWLEDGRPHAPIRS